jgi:hypothetical protein
VVTFCISEVLALHETTWRFRETVCVVAGNWLWYKVSELHDNELVAQVLVNAVFLQLNDKWSSSCDKKM